MMNVDELDKASYVLVILHTTLYLHFPVALTNNYNYSTDSKRETQKHEFFEINLV